MTHKFLELLAPDGEITFQTFGEGVNETDQSLVRVLHGTFDEHSPLLADLNNCGAGIFYMVNRGDGVNHQGNRTCRTTENVASVRAIFVDLDGSPIEPVVQCAAPPNIVVESSPERWHAYWITSDCPLEDFFTRQQQLAAKFDGDPAVTDLPRVMRLPGFIHHKGEPFMTRLVYPSTEEFKS